MQSSEALTFREVWSDLTEVLYSACLCWHQITGQVLKPSFLKYLYPWLTQLCSHETSQLLWHFEKWSVDSVVTQAICSWPQTSIYSKFYCMVFLFSKTKMYHQAKGKVTWLKGRITQTLYCGKRKMRHYQKKPWVSSVNDPWSGNCVSWQTERSLPVKVTLLSNKLMLFWWIVQLWSDFISPHKKKNRTEQSCLTEKWLKMLEIPLFFSFCRRSMNNRS